jgi:hypothetical protein
LAFNVVPVLPLIFADQRAFRIVGPGREVDGPGLQHIGHGARVMIFAVPTDSGSAFSLTPYRLGILSVQERLALVWNSQEKLFELLCLNTRRQGSPTITIPQEYDEVGTRGNLLTTRQLLQAEVDGLLVERGFLIHSPAQVDRLKARSSLLAILA